MFLRNKFTTSSAMLSVLLIDCPIQYVNIRAAFRLYHIYRISVGKQFLIASSLFLKASRDRRTSRGPDGSDTPTDNSCSATQLRPLNYKKLRSTDTAPVIWKHKVNKFHVPVILPTLLPFKTVTQ